MLSLVIFCMLFFFQVEAATIAPIVVPIVLMVVTIGAVYGLKLNGSRTRTVIGAVATCYAAIGPLLDSTLFGIPKWPRLLIVIAGILFTALNERVQGGVSDPEKRVTAARQDS